MSDLQTLIERAVTQIGFELVDLEVSNRGKMLRLFIDKPNGITIDDCALVSEQVSNMLAVEHDIDYDRLEVSSPGLDRVLKRVQDYERFIGSKISVKVRMPVDNRKKFTGKLLAVNNDTIQIECESAILDISLSNVDKTRLVPEF